MRARYTPSGLNSDERQQSNNISTWRFGDFKRDEKDQRETHWND